jgi:hypothetical protein
MSSEDRILPGWLGHAARFAARAVPAILLVAFVIARADGLKDEQSQASTEVHKAVFPPDAAKIVAPGVDVYYFHDAVGEVTTTEVEDGRLVVCYTIAEGFSAQFSQMNSYLQVFEDQKQPGSGWLTVVPRTDAGRKMTPQQAARIWGRSAES